MARPTISLCLIAKNEAHNIPELFKSIEGCFDEIIFVDTGSTDATIDTAKYWAEKIKTNILIENFSWIKDFSAARNHALKFVQTDYWMWLDLDDSLVNKEAFIAFRDHAMQFCDYWLASYDYASDINGKPTCTFARERVIKTSFGMEWKYFLHEGVVPKPGVQSNFITTWRVKHRRTQEDLNADKSRNLDIFESKKEQLDPRMMFYYGKELFEAGKKVKACEILGKAMGQENMEMHDRILAIQYACYAYQQCEDHDTAMQIALQGSMLDSNRAEFHTIMAESYIKKNDFKGAIPYFSAAKKCIQPHNGGTYAGPIFTNSDLYGRYPTISLAKCYGNLGMIDLAYVEALEAHEKWPSDETKVLLADLNKIKKITNINAADKQVEDIVISCPPQAAYAWDEELYKTKGMGGSETAAIELAKHLKKLTGRKVKIFNVRDQDLVADSGVEYISNKKLNEYMTEFKPAVHIAWRHNIRVTNSKTFAWCHDLMMPGAEMGQNFDGILALSPFHKNYLNALQGIPKEKIIQFRNGIDPEKFKFDKPKKDPNKIVWLSSPDRGLINAIPVLEKVRETLPNIKLHIYYGLDNLYKYGLTDLANTLQKMIDDNKDWIVYHGFTEQKKMTRDISDAVVWLHPANFIETFCITAIETLALSIYPVARRLGALGDTLGDAEFKGDAVLLEHDAVTPEERQAYANEVIKVIKEKRWERMSFDAESHSWESVAKDFIKIAEL